MENPLMDFLSNMMGNGRNSTKYEAVAPLSSKDNQEWDRIISELEKAKSRMMELEARKKIFWIKLERKLGMFDRNLKIESGIVMAEVQNKNNCQTPGEKLALPGFCDGNCNECSQKPEEEDSDL